MNKKFLLSVLAMIGSAVLIVLLGAAFNVWDLGFKINSLIGIVVILPAIIWVFTKGVNYINSAMYFGGIAYIFFVNIFKEITLRFIIVSILLFALAVAFGYFASLLEIDTESLKKNSNADKKGQDEING